MTYYFVPAPGEGSAEGEAAAEPEVPDEPNRGDILAAIEAAKAAIEGDPDNAELAYELADLHYKAGHFNTAKELLQPLMDAGKASDDAKLLMGELEYLTGNYAAAEEILLDLKENASDVMTQIMAQVKLIFVYYQTNEFAKTQDLLTGMEGGIQLPTWDFMKGFGDEPPYQIDWHGKTETTLPFVLADPLPVVEVEINGEPVYTFLDTGGDAFVVDTDLAAALGIEPITTFKGTFAGGLQADTSYAKTDSLKLGDVTITSVPVMILPIERFSEGFAEGQYPLRGVLGTATLRQFLSTIDYENNQIILRPKTEAAKEALMSSLTGKEITAIPFALAATHMMMAKGQLNDKDDMTMFVDSGLGRDDGAMMTAFDGQEGLNLVKQHDPDLVILDIMLPELDGLEVCRRMRGERITPILMLTAKAEEIDRVVGLELGADDYLTKPFSIRELLARVKAILRRVEMIQMLMQLTSTEVIKQGDLYLNTANHKVVVAGKAIDLAAKEFELLRLLAANPGRVFSRAYLRYR